MSVADILAVAYELDLRALDRVISEMVRISSERRGGTSGEIRPTESTPVASSKR